jgi:hypothetical protein
MAISHWSSETGLRFDENGGNLQFIPNRQDHL